MLVVNLFGAPGAGKSTLSHLITGSLKTRHSDISVECPNEIAKLIVYDEAHKALKCQLYVAGRQFWQVARCKGHADIVVCDSPILMSYTYGTEVDPDMPPTFYDVCLYHHKKFPSLNVLVKRNHPYENVARVHSEEESQRLESRIQNLMDISLSNYIIAEPSASVADEIANMAATMARNLK